MLRNVRVVAWISVASLVLAGCSHAAHPTSAPSAAAPSAPPASPPAPTQRPSVTVTPTSTAPVETPSTAASGTPKNLSALLPPPPKSVPKLASDAAPQILRVAVSETTVHPGDRVFGRVETTSNVASVQARVGGYAMNLVKVGVGRFELTYTVAPLPWFVRGNFTMQVIARNPRGDTVTRAIPLMVR